MTLIVLAIAIAILLVLIGLKVNPFVALLVTSFLTGLMNGMGPDATLKSLLKGFGETTGSVGLIILFGAVLGKMIEESGAAHAIAGALTRVLGRDRVQLSVVITAFLVGLAVFYQPAFLLLTPLIYTLSTTAGLPLMYLAIPLCAALSVTHGYLPPHPGPTAVAVMLHADVNYTLLYGLVIAIPAVIVAGPLFALFFRRLPNKPPAHLFHERTFSREELPGLWVSLATVLCPVFIMLAGAAVALNLHTQSALTAAVRFLSDPNVALFLAMVVAFYTLGLRRGCSVDRIMRLASEAISGAAMLVFVIAAGGAFKQVVVDGGTGEAIRHVAGRLDLPPIVLAWGTAALLRGAIGSATIAAITTSGIILPILPASGVRPELIVLAIGAGSVMFSHFSDAGFWMFKEYYNLSIRQTLSTWTVMEIIIGVVGLAGVLLLNLFLGAPRGG
jgi:gluconate transporter